MKPTDEQVERVKTAISEKFAPAIDFRAPYAKVMLDAAARAAIAAMPEPWMLIDERAKAGPVLLGWFEFDASVGHWEDAYDAFGYLTEDFEFKVYDRQPIHWQPLPTRPSPQKDEQP